MRISNPFRWGLILACLFLLACSEEARVPEPPANARSYEVRGRVVSVDPAVRELMVEHEEIPGFMKAMTMPFYVGHKDELRGLAAGDQITGELLVWEQGARLRKVRKVAKSP